MERTKFLIYMWKTFPKYTVIPTYRVYLLSK